MPVVLSTIAWFDLASYWRGANSMAGRWAAVARFVGRAACPAWPSWRRRLYRAVDALLPNSAAEARQLVRYFQVPPGRIHVVPNGADEQFARADPEPFARHVGVRGFVLCPGRIEPRKNQLALIRALRPTRLPLVLVGDVVPGHEPYYAACRQAAGPEVRWVQRLDHDDPTLASAYAACGCLALASWYETPSLAALEAAMSGVPLVLPVAGAAHEYFGVDAWYVKPGDLGGIRNAVLAALDRGRNANLARRVQSSYSWNAAAAATRRAYAQVI
jgi:glycosyltransferase involved in cell wall biosynthesis